MLDFLRGVKCIGLGYKQKYGQRLNDTLLDTYDGECTDTD